VHMDSRSYSDMAVVSVFQLPFRRRRVNPSRVERHMLNHLIQYVFTYPESLGLVPSNPSVAQVRDRVDEVVARGSEVCNYQNGQSMSMELFDALADVTRYSASLVVVDFEACGIYVGEQCENTRLWLIKTYTGESVLTDQYRQHSHRQVLGRYVMYTCVQITGRNLKHLYDGMPQWVSTLYHSLGRLFSAAELDTFLRTKIPASYYEASFAVSHFSMD
jgi:hypothetical protein